jgi:hypothetical protein
MCLQVKYTEEQRKQITEQKDEFEVYKVIAKHVDGIGYVPPFSVITLPSSRYIDRDLYKNGLNEADTSMSIHYKRGPGLYFLKYDSGFHFYEKEINAKETAEFLNKNYNGAGKYQYSVIKCTVKREWITDIGEEWGMNNGKFDIAGHSNCIIFVTSKAIFNLPK